MWTKEEVKKKLEENPQFEAMLKGESSNLYCCYDINGIGVKLFNTLDKIEVWLLNTPFLYEQIKDIRDFALKAQAISNELFKQEK